MEGALEADGWKEIYIGLTSLNETSGKYHWVDGSPLKYTNWKKGEPDHPDKNKCVLMEIKSGEWAAVNCVSRRLPMICKRPNPDAS
ncbi:hypothetical protein WR25_15186 isoform D [Diploscapter pachys]|nr:hypothetical protein WR25_15186 isoform B [Diploscapter pachys]PAV78433.1 hypothetical protein WR25_15186 isoform C [Diploscapter pachys]PAV78434.1 hypothetical protein WR25_15186 isoform D [Diploscapter pachys]